MNKKNKKCGELMNIYEIVFLLSSFWLMIFMTIALTYVITKDRVPNVITKVIDNTKKKNITLEPEVVTEQMEYDIEEGVKYDYNGTRY